MPIDPATGAVGAKVVPENVNVAEKTEGKFTEEITPDVASRLLQDYTVLLRGEIQSVEILHTKNHLSAVNLMVLAMPIVTISGIYSILDLPLKFIYYCIVLVLIIFVAFIMKLPINRVKSMELSYFKVVYNKLEKIVTASYILYEKHTLSYWEQQELGAKIANAEAVLDMARKIMKKS
jgi:hypothetical protein